MAESITDILRYDSKTGKLFWLVGHRKGKEAGCRRSDGYIMVRIKGKLQYAHRIVWFIIHGHWPDKIDHIDGNPSNNAQENLRECAQWQNTANSRRNFGRKLPKGVTFIRSTGKYMARVTKNYKGIYVGVFNTPAEAKNAYDNKARELWGEFAACNGVGE